MILLGGVKPVGLLLGGGNGQQKLPHTDKRFVQRGKQQRDTVAESVDSIISHMCFYKKAMVAKLYT